MVQDNQSADASNAAMSNAKKKRMKRMKAKQRKEDEEAKKASESHIPNDSLNPMDKLRGRLVDLGYNLKVVDTAMDEMWNLQMDYSDFESVLNFLQGGGGIPKQSQLTVEVDDEDEDKQGDVGTEVVLSHSTMGGDSIAGASISASYSIQADEPNAIVTDTDTFNYDDVEAAPVQQQPDVRNKKSPRVKPLDLSAKLDIVANSEHLNDGIIALTEWVNKAASPSEIQELCSSTTTNALRTVIRRSIQPQNTNSTGQLLDLVGSILRKIGAPTNQLVSTARALGMLLRKATDSISSATSSSVSGTNIEESIANNVAECSVKSLSSMVDSLIARSNSSATAMKQLEGEIQEMEGALASMKNANGSANIMDLMMKRDKTKAIADKCSNLIHVSLKKASHDSHSSNGVGASDGFVVKSRAVVPGDVMKQILGDGYDNVVSSKAKLHDLKARELQTNSSFSDRDLILSTIDALTADKVRIGNKMEMLKKELEQLIVEEVQLQEKVNTAQSKFNSLEGSLSHEARQVSGQLDAIANNVKVEECVSAIAKEVCNFANVMDAASSAQDVSVMDVESNGSKDSLDNALGSLLTATSRYFASELKTIEYLEKRATKIQADIPNLQREIMEFAALGMATTVSDMKKKEKEMQDNVVDDKELVEALTREANGAKNTFIEQLQGFLASPAFDQTKQESYASALKETDRILADIGINGDTKWSSVMIMYGSAFASSSRNVGSSGDDGKQKEKRTGWNLARDNGSNQAKSLLDIQNEQR